MPAPTPLLTLDEASRLIGRAGFGDEHAANIPTAVPGPSRRHSNVTPVSCEENVNWMLRVLIGPLGPLSIVVLGAVVSTVQVTLTRDAVMTGDFIAEIR